NFEARGSRGASIMFETGAHSGGLIAELGRAVPHPIANSLANAIYQGLQNDTDLTAFRRLRVAGLNFAYIEGAAVYHSRVDDADHLDPGSLQHHGDYALGLARRLGAADLEAVTGSDGDQIYFDVLGRWLVRYSTAWGLFLVGIALALVV